MILCIGACVVCCWCLLGRLSMVGAFSIPYSHPRASCYSARSILATTSRTLPPPIVSSISAVGAITTTLDDNEEICFDSLVDMDIVIYSKMDGDDKSSERKLLLGAIQEDGSLAPISAWTMEPAFGQSVEFLVDEEDRFSLNKDQTITSSICVHYLLQESEMSYGSRQCHRGVGNPHGEESELLYYVEQSVIETFHVEVAIKPELEILW